MQTNQPPKPSPPKEWPSEWKDDPHLLQLASEHEAWLRQPTTQIALSIVKQLREEMATHLGTMSTRLEVPDTILRVYAGQIKQIETITKILNDTPTFVKRASDH